MKKESARREQYPETPEEQAERENFQAGLQQDYTRIARSAGLNEGERGELFAEMTDKVGEYRRKAAEMRRKYFLYLSAVDEMEGRMHDIVSSKKKRRIIQPAPANSVIDLAEEESGGFARGMSIYKLLMILFLGSFAGVVIELLWCLIRNGYWESRSGLVWGPFNLLYGVGAVALTAALYPFRNNSGTVSFAGGLIVGSGVEYLCSLVQELCFGSRSWDYSGMPFNLNGRICLMYSVFWGLLGVMWIKSIYPRAAKIMLKLPERPGKGLILALTVFLCVNALVSGCAVARWSQRIQGDRADNVIERLLDDHFDDARMERIYANMEFGA